MVMEIAKLGIIMNAAKEMFCNIIIKNKSK